MNCQHTVSAHVLAAILSLAFIPSPSQAGSISVSTTAPTVDGADVSNAATPTGSQKWFDDVEHDAGQTFTPASSGLLTSFTIYLAQGNANDAAPNENVDLRFGTISRPGGVFTFTDVHTENASLGNDPDWLANDYITFTFDTPQAVTAGVEYGIITDAQSMGAWQQGIPYRHTTGDTYAGGSLINRGGEITNNDVWFHANITTGGPDTTPPAISSLNPADDSTDASTGGNLVITFDEDVQKGTTGNIVITETGVGVFETIPVTDARISVSGAAVTIDPAGTLLDSTDYDVQIDAGAIRDTAASPNDFPGILDATTWNFTTAVVDVTNPTVLALSPADDEVGVSTLAHLVLTFDEDVQKGTGDIVVTETGVGVFETIPVGDAAVTVTGDTVTVDLLGTLADGTDYHVEVASGALEDLSGNDFLGISGTTDWNFTTLAAPGVATISISTTAPTIDGLDEANLVTPTGSQKWFDDVEHDAGQTFTPASNGLLTSFTIYLAQGNENDAAPNENVDVRFGTISRPGGVFTFTDVAVENASLGNGPDWLANDYITFTFETPQAVTAGVEYGVITDAQLMGAWQQGIPYRHTSGDTYAGGSLINRGGEITGSDLIFHANITPTGGGGNDFSDWIAGYSVGGQTGIGDDPDGDGSDSGVENFFGTAPDTFTQGLISGSADTGAGTFTFTHPQGTLADDLAAAYRWSVDLVTFNADGASDGTNTVVFSTQADTPVPGTTTVTATVTVGPVPESLFADVEVTQNP